MGPVLVHMPELYYLENLIILQLTLRMIVITSILNIQILWCRYGTLKCKIQFSLVYLKKNVRHDVHR